MSDIGAVINGLFFLFLEPNPQDPLNKEAAELMKDNLPAFVSPPVFAPLFPLLHVPCAPIHSPNWPQGDRVDISLHPHSCLRILLTEQKQAVQRSLRPGYGDSMYGRY
jgi:hypothetical protein